MEKLILKDKIEELYLNYQKPLQLYSYNFCKDWSIAEECVQIVFLKLLEQQDTIQILKSMSGYLYTAVRNETLQQIKYTNKNTAIDGNDERFEEMFIEIFKTKDSSQNLYLAIDKLPTKCRQILILKRLENKSYVEISKILGISTKTVENQVGNAFKKLRKFLKNDLK